jgi:hypothetical protein
MKNAVTQSNQCNARFEVLTAVLLNDSGLVGCYVAPSSSDSDSPRLINLENESPVILQSVRSYLPNYTAYHRRRLESSSNVTQLYF